MEHHIPADIPTDTIDVRALAALITELNISRRNFKSYPKDHPVVETGFRKVISRYDKLLKNADDIVISVSRENLLLGSTILDASNPVFHDFAHTLFEHDIAVLILRQGLTTAELRNFNIILGLKRDELNRYGGIQELWEKGQIQSLSIKAIRYDLFSASGGTRDGNALKPDNSGDIWERFVRLLTIDDNQMQETLSGDDFDPEMLAAILNSRLATLNDDSGDTGKILESAIDVISLVSTLPSTDPNSRLLCNKLGTFISKLTIDLRRQILSSCFETTMEDGSPVAEAIISNMPVAIISETLHDLVQHQADVPPVIMGLLKKLAKDSSTARSDGAAEDANREKIQTIFSEHAAEEYVPDHYQTKLNAIISESQIPLMAQADQYLLLATVDSHQVENRISDIIMNLFMNNAETPEERDFLLQSLEDMFGYFLQTGDYIQLLKMIEQSGSSLYSSEIQCSLRESYSRREFLDEILRGLTIWGKPRYGDIQHLVAKIGTPFIEVLLDRIAIEDNMSLRRFMMDRLIEMGPAAKDPVANRLGDNRWYVLRNLVTILRHLDDPAIIPLIRPLSRHSNNRLRHEVLSALVSLHDPSAVQQILHDLDSSEREVQLAAITLSEMSYFPDIHNKLIAMLSKDGLSQVEYDLKSAVVKALGELHRNESLAEFIKILGSTSFLNSKLLTHLKIDIIRALERYPQQAVAPLLERLCSAKGDLARQARESLTHLQGRLP